MITAFLLYACAVAVEQVEPCPESMLRPGPLELENQFSQLGQCEREYIKIYRVLRPSLVQVQLTGIGPAALPKPNEEKKTTNFVVSGVVLRETENGCMVVIPGIWQIGADAAVQVVDLDGQHYPGTPIAHAEGFGLSLINVPGLRLEAPPFGICEAMPIGSITFSLGNPFGLDGSFGMGMLSGRARNIGKSTDLIQVTNPMNPGDGGGMIADCKGRVIAIAMSSLSDFRLLSADGQGSSEALVGARQSSGISFAIPLHKVLHLFGEHLALPPELPRPTLGIEVQVAVIPPAIRRDLGLAMRTGLRVLHVEPNGPAAAAKVESGDYLLGLEGYPTEDFASLFYALRLVRSSASLQVLRESQALDLHLNFPPAGEAQLTQTPNPGRLMLTPPALQEDKD
ncbi:MAG: serine protease [Planctomycetes bacterium]|nr:serine protease [Planctomycetota bacterium]